MTVQAVAAYAKRKAAALVMETQIRRHIARQAVMAIRREKAALVIQRTFRAIRSLVTLTLDCWYCACI